MKKKRLEKPLFLFLPTDFRGVCQVKRCQTVLIEETAWGGDHLHSRIEDRLTKARQQNIVGRDAEIDAFRFASTDPTLPFLILHVWGPGGVGKTTLLRAYAEVCQDLSPVYLDAHDFEASPDGLRDALRVAMSLDACVEPIEHLSARGHRLILFVDSYDALSGLDAYLRDRFLPLLPDDALIVLASREPLSAAWRGDSGWQSLIHSLPLRNLNTEASRRLLTQRGVPDEHHETIVRMTHGFPLALSLLVDVYKQRGVLPPQLVSAPESLHDIVPALLERLVPLAPSSAHRAALEICALVRTTDEALLDAALSDQEKSQASAHEVFRWLQNLSFIEAGHPGIHPHDIARDSIIADLQWRNRERFIDLHRRVRTFYTARLPRAQGQEQQRLLYDCIFLHRESEVVRAAFTWQDTSLVRDTLRETDHAPITAMVTRHEGEAAGKTVSHWLTTQPQDTTVFRDSQKMDGPPVGFYTLLSLADADERDRNADPTTRAAWRYLNRNAPLRPGESATYLRFWMANDTHQGVSPIQSLILVHLLRHFLTQARPAYTFFACRKPDEWEAALSYLGLPRLSEAEPVSETVGGVFGRDWRALPPVQWLAYLAEREEAANQPVALPGVHGIRVTVLSESDFKQSVLEALRAYTSVETLQHNPLACARLVVSHTGLDADVATRAQELRARVQQAAQTLQSHPRTARGYRALHHTYLNPAGTQEQAATILGLPFNTYRHHLAAGINELTNVLWLQETGNASPDLK